MLATDNTTEREYARLCDPDDCGVYTTRVAYANPTNAENLAAMGPRIEDAARLILPGQDLDVVAYACTAASVVLGDGPIAETIAAAKPGAACVTPTSAARAAFDALGVTRISVLTPYSKQVTGAIRDYLTMHGLVVVNTVNLDMEDDREMARVPPTAIARAGMAAMHPEAEALFVSCTALRAVETVQAMETQTGKPVVTSNQAMIWRSLRLAGDSRPRLGYGRLLTL